MVSTTDLLQVTWNAVLGATGYTFYVSVNSNFSPFESENTLEPSYTEYNVPPGTYYFRVSAYNANGEGAKSNVVSATVSSGTPVYSLNGIWEQNGFRVTVSGSTGVFSQIPTTNPVITDALSKGYIQLGGQAWRNLTKTGNLTWSGQNIDVYNNSNNPNVADGTGWCNGTFTMSADGQTITLVS